MSNTSKKRATILDWKTTRFDVDYTAQMLFYCWLIHLSRPDIEEFTAILVFLRDRTVRIEKWTKWDIFLWSAQYENQVINWDGRTYRPGGHCAYCPRWASCPAQSQMVTRTRQDLSVYGESHLPVEADDVIGLYERVGALEQRIKQFKDAVRARTSHEGKIQGTDKSLVLETRSRDTIDARKAWPIMDSWLWDDDIAECVSIKKTDLLRKIADSAGSPGTNKGHKKKLFMEALHEAGAVTTKEYTTLSLKQTKSKETDIVE